MKFFRTLSRAIQRPSVQLLLLIGLVGVTYISTLPYAFVSDDITSIVNFMPTATIQKVFDTTYVFHFSPAMFFGIYRIFGLSPLPYRLINILFHTGSVVVLYLIVSRLLDRRTAFWASAFFAVHPLIIESVTWISGGIYAAYGFWFLLSFLFFLRGNGILSLLFFGISLAFSEKAIVLPLINVSYLLVKRIFLKQWKELIPYALFSMLAGSFYLTKLPVRIQSVALTSFGGSTVFFNPLEQIPIAITTYLQLFVWPDTLTFYHADLTQTVARYLLRLGAFVGAGIGAWFLIRKEKTVLIWVSLVLVPLIPTLLPIKIAWIVAERYAYLSTAGLSVLFVVVCNIVCASKHLTKILPFFFFLLLACLWTRTVIRNRDWQNQDTLWVATVIASPTSPLAWNNMGDVFSRHGDLRRAAGAFQEAIRLHPTYADAYHNLGETYRDMKRLDDAIAMYQKALICNPSLWQSHMSLAGIYLTQGKYDQALEEINQAEHVSPNNSLILRNKAVIKELMHNSSAF